MASVSSHTARPAGDETSSPEISSKKDGKKRAVDDDGDATATDEEGPSQAKTTKKKRGMNK